MTQHIEGAKLVGGVWLPETEKHFVEMMGPTAKRHQTVDGKWTYQYHKLRAAMEYQPRDRRRLCIDVGAHAGLWSMWLVKEFDEIEAFEPIPLHRECFRENVWPGCWATYSADHVADAYWRTDNEYRELRLWPYALGAAPGTVSIETAADETGSAHVARNGGGDPRKGHGPLLTYTDIEMRTLDSFGFENVDFIKIDVEGYELDVVKGAYETLLRCKPNLVVEQKGNDTIYGHKRNAAVEYLTGLGYRSVKVISGDHIMVWHGPRQLEP